MTRPAGAAGTASAKTHFYEEAMHRHVPPGDYPDHDKTTDASRVVFLDPDRAQLVQILGWGLMGSEGTFRARLTAEQETTLAKVEAWARQRWAVKPAERPQERRTTPVGLQTRAERGEDSVTDEREIA